MKVNDIVYNIHRYINYTISVLEGFLQSPMIMGFQGGDVEKFTDKLLELSGKKGQRNLF